MKKPFGLKLEIHDPELGGLLGGGPNRVLVSKNASIGNIRATTTDPAASKLGAIGEGGIEGKYRVSIFQGSAPLTHESFRSKKNAIAYAVDWKKRKDRNLGFSAKLRLREFSALRKRVRVKWHSDGSARMTIPNAYGGVNEIGRIETSVSSKRGTSIGQVKWVEIDPKFRGMGLATKMYGEAMKGAPRGRLVSDNAQYGGGYGVWNKLQRNKGYKVRENPKIDGAGFDDLISRDGRPMFIGRINPAAIKQNNLSAKLRLQAKDYMKMRHETDIASRWKRKKNADGSVSYRFPLKEFSAPELHEFGLLGHPLEYSRPYIYGDRRLPRGEGAYEAPEAFRLNNQGESFARGQEAAIAKARKGGVISVGLKKTTKGGWRAIAQENGLTRAADAKRSVLRHELIHSIQRAKAASQGKSYVRGMMNPIKRYVAEVGAYAAENRRRPGRGLVERLFPTFKAVLSAKASM